MVGSLIGIAVSQPEIAIVLAYASHFALDATPHFGYGVKSFNEGLEHAKKSRIDQIFIALSAITFVALIVFLLEKSDYFLLILGLVAILPDIFITYNYWFYERKNKNMKGPLAELNLKIHGKIQYERPWGIWVESIVFAILVTIFLHEI
jgi:hypothetical protein